MTEEITNKEQENVENVKKEEKQNNIQTDKNLNFLLDIPVSVTVELGKTKLLLKDLLKLDEGAILELDKFEGEPVDILVNNKLIAKGEVVIINERFGVKIIDIISTQERVKQLK